MLPFCCTDGTDVISISMCVKFSHITIPLVLWCVRILCHWPLSWKPELIYLRHCNLMSKKNYVHVNYTQNFKCVFIDTMFFKTVAMITQKSLEHWFVSNTGRPFLVNNCFFITSRSKIQLSMPVYRGKNFRFRAVGWKNAQGLKVRTINPRA